MDVEVREGELLMMGANGGRDGGMEGDDFPSNIRGTVGGDVDDITRVAK